MIRASIAGAAAALGFACSAADPGDAPVADPASVEPAVQATRTVALTFDDLPGVFVDTSLAAARAANETLLASLRAAGAHATGFVNEDKLRGLPERAALLELWLDGGMDLGNHTYSHPDLHSTPLSAYQEDVLRGERVTRALMAERGLTPRWFRHPFLHSGRSVETRTAFEQFLSEHGYTVAPVTIDNYDYIFARAYDRADGEVADSILAAYVTYMDTIFGYYEAQSQSLFGREPAHVLLLHVSRLNGDAMDELLAMMSRRGYAVVPLDTAMADPIYRSADSYTGPAGITWLHRWAITSGVPGSAFAGEPDVPAWISRRSDGEP